MSTDIDGDNITIKTDIDSDRVTIDIVGPHGSISGTMTHGEISGLIEMLEIQRAACYR